MLDGKPQAPPPDMTIEVRVATVATDENPNPLPERFKRKPGEAVDYEAIEPLYRAGILSLKEIGLMYDITAAGILKHARKQKPPWERDIEARVQARANTKVREALIKQAEEDDKKLVNAAEGEVNRGALVNATPVTKIETRDMSRPINNAVEGYAEVLMRVRLGQNERFREVAALCMTMFTELKEQVAARPLLNELGDLMIKPDENGYDKLNEIYRKVIEFPGQVRAMKDLADVIGQLTAWEARAFKLDTAPMGDQGRRKYLAVRFVEATPAAEEPGDGA
jgi:hypothetical protein